MTPDSDDDPAPRKRNWIDREGILQTHVFQMCKAVIALDPADWQFLAYDRGKASSANDYARQAARGRKKGAL